MVPKEILVHLDHQGKLLDQAPAIQVLVETEVYLVIQVRMGFQVCQDREVVQVPKVVQVFQVPLVLKAVMVCLERKEMLVYLVFPA